MIRIELGDRVRDRITGVSGIAIGATDWLYACRRIVVQPEKSKDDKPVDNFCVDEPQLALVKAGVIQAPALSGAASPQKTGGLRPDPARREDPKRF